MRYAALVLLALALAGCSVFEDEAQRGYSRTNAFAFPAAFTNADLRIVTERKHPVTGQDVVCTEPSPDVAKAVSAAFAATAQASGGTGSGSGSGSLSGATAEAVAELAGRSTALLGLRDGLFQACQAYANGAIGADSYALIVSHYGQLMTTLFLGQDIAGVGAAEAKASQQAPSITTNTPASGGGTSVNISTPPPTAASATTAPSTPAAGAAAALTRMNEDYFNIDYNFIHMLAVVCINQSDPTVEAPPDPNTPANALIKYRALNPWLTQICPLIAQALGPSGTKAFIEGAKQLVAGHVLAPPVDPMAATLAPKTSAATTPKASAPTAAQITAAQTKLEELAKTDTNLPDCTAAVLGKPSGKLDALTEACVTEFQREQKPQPTVNGQLDTATLTQLGVITPAKPK